LPRTLTARPFLTPMNMPHPTEQYPHVVDTQLSGIFRAEVCPITGSTAYS
jgi:hypothetical protein